MDSKIKGAGGAANKPARGQSAPTLPQPARGQPATSAPLVAPIAPTAPAPPQEPSSFSASASTPPSPELEEIVAANTGLVRSVAQRLSLIYGEELEDLMQIGYIGLLKAAERFEPERGFRFSTYAVPLIAGEIRSQMRDGGRVKVSRELKSDAARVRRAENDFCLAHGRSPKLTELAAASGLTAERVLEALQAYEAMHDIQSDEVLAVQSGAIDEEELSVTRLDLAAALEKLPPRQRQVMVLRYYRDMTQQQVAEAVGISQVQVCRLEKRALAALAARLVR